MAHSDNLVNWFDIEYGGFSKRLDWAVGHKLPRSSTVQGQYQIMYQCKYELL